jgi:hypothetical protein
MALQNVTVTPGVPTLYICRTCGTLLTLTPDPPEFKAAHDRH